MTATATDSLKNSSEFAPPIVPTAATVVGGGRILTAEGKGIGAARLTLTNQNGETRAAISNSFGFYRLTEISSGQNYVLSVSAKRFSFAEPTRILNVSEQLTEVNFTASP